MDQSLCKLTLVGPPHAADLIIELLLAHEPPIRGFTTWSAEGHGLGFASASLEERVRGFVRRRVLVTIIPRDTAKTLLRTIGEKLAIPHLTYWIEPVESFGQMLGTQVGLEDQAEKIKNEQKREKVS